MSTFLPYALLMIPRWVATNAAFTVAPGEPLTPLTLRVAPSRPFAPSAPFGPAGPSEPVRPGTPGIGSGARGAIGSGTLSIDTGWAACTVRALPAASVTRAVSA